MGFSSTNPVSEWSRATFFVNQDVQTHVGRGVSAGKRGREPTRAQIAKSLDLFLHHPSSSSSFAHLFQHRSAASQQIKATSGEERRSEGLCEDFLQGRFIAKAMRDAWEHMMGEARKRKRSVETIGDTSTTQGPRKRVNKPSEAVLRDKSRDIYRRFQSTYQVEFSQATFLGVCAYLHTLIRWGYPISSSAFDSFICSHSTFVDDLEVKVTQRGCAPSYHHWFADHQLHQSRLGSVLDGGSLYDIAAEHPYTFARTEASMELIAKRVRDRESWKP